MHLLHALELALLLLDVALLLPLGRLALALLAYELLQLLALSLCFLFSPFPMYHAIKGSSELTHKTTI